MRTNLVIGHSIDITTTGNTDTTITDLTDESYSGGTLLRVTFKCSTYSGLSGTNISLYVGDPADDEPIIKTKYIGDVPESIEVGVYLRPTSQDLTFRVDHEGSADSFTIMVDFSYYVA